MAEPMQDINALEYTNHLEVTIPGDPKALPRHRHTKTGHTYELAWSKKYKADILSQVAPHATNIPWTGPLLVRLTFALQRPKSRTVKDPKRSTPERWARHLHPTSRPDLDNYVKMVLDALPGVFADDSQVVDIQAKKVYTSGKGYTNIDIYELRCSPESVNEH